jgi:hypothetical protein
MVVFMKMYAKGGEVSIPNADKMMHLPMEVAVYVPSTSNVDKEISATEMKARVKEVETYLAELFGGFTSSEKVGGYLSGKSGVITEKVVPVTAFATNESFSKNKNKLVNKLAVWAKKWSQEAMGLEFEGDLYYVPQKFKKGGRLTATYIPNEDIESIKTRFGQTFSGKDILDGAYVKRKVKTPKVSRYMFEEEEYEYADGGAVENYTEYNPKREGKLSGTVFMQDREGYGKTYHIVGRAKGNVQGGKYGNGSDVYDIFQLKYNTPHTMSDTMSAKVFNDWIEKEWFTLYDEDNKFAHGGMFKKLPRYNELPNTDIYPDYVDVNNLITDSTKYGAMSNLSNRLLYDRMIKAGTEETRGYMEEYENRKSWYSSNFGRKHIPNSRTAEMGLNKFDEGGMS